MKLMFKDNRILYDAIRHNMPNSITESEIFTNIFQ
jgi:hypothetical protein